MKLNKIISDGIIYQRNKPIYVTGTGTGTVTVTFLGETKTAEADGHFTIELSPRPAGGPYEMEIDLAGEKKIIHNIMIGEVLIVAGQSNAELTIPFTTDADTHFDSDPELRFFWEAMPDHDEQDKVIMRDTDFTGKWISLTEDNAPAWSALALFCALNFHEKYGVPVGIMCCYKGASVIESFLSEDIMAKYTVDASQLMLDHTWHEFPWNVNSYLYHEILLPLVPLQCSAIVWYQGESNRTVYEGTNFYEDWLCNLITMWRNLLKDEDLPFVVIQINNFNEEAWLEGVASIQKAQEKAAERMNNCPLVKIADMGYWDVIHPLNKRAVAERVCEKLF